MEITAIMEALENKQPGSFFTVVVRREAKTFKGVTDKIEKESVMQGILCDYANRKPVREAVKNDERDEPELPSHIKESFCEGNVRFWRGNNGKVYLPVNVAGMTPKVQWFLNGEPVSKDEVLPYVLASERQQPKSKEELAEKGQATFCAIGLENIIEVR